MLEYLSSEEVEGGGADPAAMNETSIFICG